MCARTSSVASGQGETLNARQAVRPNVKWLILIVNPCADQEPREHNRDIKVNPCADQKPREHNRDIKGDEYETNYEKNQQRRSKR